MTPSSLSVADALKTSALYCLPASVLLATYESAVGKTVVSVGGVFVAGDDESDGGLTIGAEVTTTVAVPLLPVYVVAGHTSSLEVLAVVAVSVVVSTGTENDDVEVCGDESLAVVPEVSFVVVSGEGVRKANAHTHQITATTTQNKIPPRIQRRATDDFNTLNSPLYYHK